MSHVGISTAIVHTFQHLFCLFVSNFFFFLFSVLLLSVGILCVMCSNYESDTIATAHSKMSSDIQMNKKYKNKIVTDFYSLNFKSIYLTFRWMVVSPSLSHSMWVWKIQCSIVENSYNTIVEGVFAIYVCSNAQIVRMRKNRFARLYFISFH